MKQLTLLFALVFFMCSYAFGQRVISGTVTDENGPLPYANVIVKGTTIGTTTDLDGKYELKVPEGATTVVISYTGYTSQDLVLGDSNVLSAVLSEGVVLEGAIVTALGIKRDQKSLGYAAQEVDGSELTKVKDANFVNSLSGKTAGVNIQRSGQLGGSSNVIIRGYTSLNGNNQALFVVDGTPVSNAITNTTNQKTGRGGYDYGNTAMDLNPEDIESVSVLRGAAATALYGSRAANGVILVTTKKGSSDDKLGVTFSSGFTAANVDKSTMPVYQKQYGPGYSDKRGWYSSDVPGIDFYDFDGDGVDEYHAPVYEDASFGAEYDPNLQVLDWSSWYPNHPNYGKTRAFVAAENDPTTFYETGLTFNNSIAVDGGNDQSSFRLSYTNFDQSGIVPGSKIKKNTISFAGDQKVTDKLRVGAAVQYINTNGKGRYGTGYDNRNVNQSFRQWYHTFADIKEQKDAYELTGDNLSWNAYANGNPGAGTRPHYFDNYYWNLANNYSTDNRDRIIGNIKMDYELTDWLSATGKVSIDQYSEIQEERIAEGSVDVSEYSVYNRNFYELNYDAMLRANKYFGASEDISVTGLLGVNIRRSKVKSLRETTNGGLTFPGVYTLENSNDLPTSSPYLAPVGVNGYYAAANIGLYNAVYLDLTGRYDVSSTLPQGENSYFYPSASLSFVFSEFLGGSDILSFGKLRANYAEVGNDADPFQIFDTYDITSPFGGPTASVNPTKKNQFLKPERTKSIEGGLEMKFLKNRLGFDVTAYKSNSFNQILDAPVTTSTGYSALVVNAGNIQNVGVEVAANLTPVKTTNFTWDIGVTWAKNQNKVIELLVDEVTGEDIITNYEIGGVQGGVTYNATVGEPYGTIQGTNYVYHTNGEPLVTPYMSSGPTGVFEAHGMKFVKSSDPEVIGNINPDWRGGINNSINYKGIGLSFLIDAQKGGDFFSLDTWYGFATGIYDFTAGNNDKGNPVRDLPQNGGGLPIGGVLQTGVDDDDIPISDGTVNTEYAYTADVFTALGYANAPNAYHVYDASFVKLREATLSYSLPSKLFANNKIDGIDISVIGRNLWIIHKNTPYSDPESSTSAGNLRGNQSGVYPTARELGLNLRVKF